MLDLVDAHHHLWDLAAVDYPWLRARGVRRFFGDPTPIQCDYTVERLRADAVGYKLASSVHIQVGCAPGQELAETHWLQACGDREGLPGAIVAAADLTDPQLGLALAAQSCSGRLRGVRQIIGREPRDDARTLCGKVLDDPAFIPGLRLLAGHGLSFDLQLTVPQMAQAAGVFAQVSQLPVALCHCGSPWDQTRAGLAAWRTGLAHLAQLPNMVCKISGLSMYDPQWERTSFVALARTVLDMFGPHRCLFGSNFPVDGLHRSYSHIVEATLEAVEPYGPQAREGLFSENARRFYRL